MDRAEIEVETAPDRVWAVLADAASYADWLVGCKTIRAVEGPWPAAGSKIHHTVGAGVATIDDATVVVESEAHRHLVLRAHARPAGIASVRFTLHSPSEGRTTVVMEEEVSDGPVSHVPDVVVDTLLHPRNAESLRRLKAVAEGSAPTG